MCFSAPCHQSSHSIFLLLWIQCSLSIIYFHFVVLTVRKRKKSILNEGMKRQSGGLVMAAAVAVTWGGGCRVLISELP